MAKNKVSEWSATASNNTDIGNINIAEGCAPSGINNAIRELMAQVKDMQTGADGDNFTVGGNLTVTGTASGATPSPGDNTTKFATTAFVTAALAAMYPVGSIYTNASNSTNPATLLGFGTWTAFAAGRVLVGLNGSDSAFDTAEETGGSKDAVVVSHTHTATTSSSGSHQHTSNTTVPRVQIGTDNGTAWAGAASGTYGTSTTTTPVAEAGAHTHSISVSTEGSSGTNANLQPYIVVYMWKRTA